MHRVETGRCRVFEATLRPVTCGMLMAAACWSGMVHAADWDGFPADAAAAPWIGSAPPTAGSQPPSSLFDDQTDVMRPAAPQPALGDGATVGETGEPWRLYASKILGLTQATLTTSVAPVGPGAAPAWSSSSSATGSMFTGAVAGGVWIPRPVGALRLECEAALRDAYDDTLQAVGGPSIHMQASNTWSVFGNVWRDVSLTRRIGLYGGGGLGGGGYRLAVDSSDGFAANGLVGQFAWQAGGGLIYRYNSLVTADIGYRFIGMGTGKSPLLDAAGNQAGTLSSTMTANELLLMLRVKDPFQGLKHIRSRSFYLPE